VAFLISIVSNVNTFVYKHWHKLYINQNLTRIKRDLPSQLFLDNRPK